MFLLYLIICSFFIRYRAAVKKREEFLFNQSLTLHIEAKQSKEYIPISIERMSKMIEQILLQRNESLQKRDAILEEVISLYRFQLVKFVTEFEAVGNDVDIYYERLLPYLSARNYVGNMPIKDREHFDYHEVHDGIALNFDSPKPHLCLNKNNLGLFRWVKL